MTLHNVHAWTSARSVLCEDLSNLFHYWRCPRVDSVDICKVHAWTSISSRATDAARNSVTFTIYYGVVDNISNQPGPPVESCGLTDPSNSASVDVRTKFVRSRCTSLLVYSNRADELFRTASMWHLLEMKEEAEMIGGRRYTCSPKL